MKYQRENIMLNINLFKSFSARRPELKVVVIKNLNFHFFVQLFNYWNNTFNSPILADETK